MKALLLLTLVTLGLIMWIIFISEYIKQEIICSKLVEKWDYSWSECFWNK